jgi:cytochrome c peroxidase
MKTLGISFWTLAVGTLLLLGVAGCQPTEPKTSASTPETASPAKTEAKPSMTPTVEQGKQPDRESTAEPPKNTSDKEDIGSMKPNVPLGLPPLPVPENNPLSFEKVDLGRMLYFDTRLSKDGTVSCATCHDPQTAWSENRPTSEGIRKQLGARNSPTVINAAYATSQFWDGRAKTLEEQALGPIENPVEMGHDLNAMVNDLAKLDEYAARFQKVFGTPVTKEGVAKALAAFERTVLSGNSPYDRYQAGEKTALNDAQKRGLALFEENCATCHAPPTFSNYRFYNAGVGMEQVQPDEGRKKVTARDGDLGKFRVPALREVAKTHPYFHNGSAATLEEAVALMAGGGKENPHLSTPMKAVQEAKLTAENQKDIVEFLKALSGGYPIVEPPKLPEEFKPSTNN